MTTADDDILTEARTRFKRCEDWESTARQRHVADMKFAEGDSDNGWQWEDKQVASRRESGRPALTVNKTREHNLQILNDQRQNKSQIRVRPTGDGATFKAAQIFEGIVRHIEYQSRALEAYDAAAYSQIYAGIGFWRIETDYVGDDSFDQDIFIRRERDALGVYLDPDIQQFDGSDARFGFRFRDVPRDQAETDYPWLKKEGVPGSNGVDRETGWLDKDHVRECDYFRVVERSDELLHMAVPDEMGQVQEAMRLRSDLPEGFDDDAHGQLIQRRRPVTRRTVEWFKIVGTRIVDRREWAGSYVPLVRVVGEETVIDGKMDRKGHTRALKDAQRMYNWYTSEACTYAAGQTKTPYIGPVQAFEGLEGYWNSANTETRPYLPYNAVSEDGREIAAPQKMPPPVSHSAAIEGMKIAQMEMMMASGQYQSQFGENENAKSGVAIQTRQRQGDNATYHYIDHLAQAITFTGRQLIELIPKIYDTPRVIKIMAEDGEQTEVNIDPNGPAYEQRIKGQPANEEQVKAAQADPELRDSIETFFNPTVGKFDVEADIGPAFATKRQEAFAAMTDIAKQNPDFMKIGGDLYFRSADFPMSDELAERFQRTIPPAILGQGPSPQDQQMQAQMQQMQAMIGQLTQQLAEKGAAEHNEGVKRQIEDYRAETERMKAIGAIDPVSMVPVVRQVASEALGTPVVPLMGQHAAAEAVHLLQPAPAAGPGQA